MKIAWLNNVQAPYREPMFSELSKLVDFEASFFFADEKVRHWSWRPHSGYRSSVVPSWRVPVPARLGQRLGDEVGVLRPGVTSRVLRDADALVTQVWWQPAHLWAMVRCRMRGIPYLIYAESTLESRSVGGGLADNLRSLVFRHAGAVIVPGPAAAEAAVLNGAPPGRVVESVNSVDVDLYGDRVRQLRGTAAGDGPHRFVCIGQLIERKNVGSLIRALAALGGDARLEVAGDGVEQDGLRALVAGCGLAGRVRFLGFLEEPAMLELLARSHTLVLPSVEEVYGYTALEAHVAGLQVVVSDQAGIARNLEGRPGTWIVAPTVEGLTTALRAAEAAWSGWQHDVDVEFASPRRVAQDIVAAVAAARGMPAEPAGNRAPEETDPTRTAEPGSNLDADADEPTPAVSVCIPLYMKERYVGETIRSILDQTFTDFELIILHNASPDRSAEVAASFDDPRIRLLHNAETVSGQENHARVVGFARAELVKVVAADDVLHPTALAEQVAVMRRDPAIALVSCRQNMIGEHSEIVYRDRSLRTPDLLGRQNRTTVLRRVVRHTGNPVGAFVNLLFRRSAYLAAGGMPDVPFVAGDLGLAMELLRFGDFYGIEKTLVDFRIASGSASASDGRAGIDDQVGYIEKLRVENGHLIRPTDAVYGRLRTPVMRLRHGLIISAAGAKDSSRTRAATMLLSMGRRKDS